MKPLLSILLIVLCVPCLAGHKDPVVIDNVSVKRTDGNVDVSFSVIATRGSVPRNYSEVITPALSYGTTSESLPAVVVCSKRQYRLMRRSETLSKYYEMPKIIVVSGRQTQPFNYLATRSYTTRMKVVSLDINRSIQDCSDQYNAPSVNMMRNVVLQRDYSPYLTYIPINSTENIISQNKKLTVYFRQAKSTIVSDYMDNQSHIDSIYSTMERLKDESAVIKLIEIAGFTSPEGNYSYNLKLSDDRALALKHFIVQKFNIQPDVITTFHGGDNWLKLRAMVDSSDMKSKEAILSIIDNDNLSSQHRNSMLFALDKGEAYSYMYKNFFPTLRSGCSLKISYDTKVDETSLIINSAIKSIDNKRYAEALDKLRSISVDPRAFNAIGVCYMMTDDIPSAMVWFRKAAESGSSDALKNINEIEILN